MPKSPNQNQRIERYKSDKIKKGLTASPTLGFPGGSLGREGGRGGGGGGVGLTDDGVAGRTGEEEPEEAPKKHKWDSFNYSV